MISETVMDTLLTENRNDCNSDFAERVIYPRCGLMHTQAMLTTAQLLEAIDRHGIRNRDIATTLGVSPSRVTEIRKGERVVKLDEAVKLVEAFGLESEPALKVPPLPPAVARLIVLYIAAEFGMVAPQESRVESLSQDIRAFAEFVTDPQVRGSVDAAEHFFRAMRLRRPAPLKAD